jgi:transposase InsO family protein
VSISEFCKQLGISRPSYFKVKKRYLAEGNKALNPHSRAPKSPARVHGDQTTVKVLRLRERLRKSGWDNGPQSIWFEGVDTNEFGATLPSVATIGRILSESGLTKTNPRKRPRGAWLRFARSHPMGMWQLDGLEYRLFDPDGTKVLIYQLLDDGTRFDVGSQAFARLENGEDAIAALQAAFTEYGVPQQLLSDNGVAFNQSRRGVIGQTELFLAALGCHGIAGSVRHPQTPGKNERSHQTLIRFLDAPTPKTLEQLSQLLVKYRDHYNYRRRHQALKIGTTSLTPGQAWEAGEHRGSDGVAIDITVLEAAAMTYKDRLIAQDAAAGREVTSSVVIAPLQPPEPVPERVVRLQEQFDDVVEIRRTNPQIYYRGRIFTVPTYLVGTYQLVANATGFTLFDTTDGQRASSSRCRFAWPPANGWCRCGRSPARGSATRIHPGN